MAEIKRIMIPVDFSETGQFAARHGQELARAIGAELLVLHVLNEPAFALPEESSYMSPAITAEYESAMRRKLQGVTEALAAPGVKVTGKLVHGTPHAAITGAAEAEQADLIVMGTHGRSGVSHLLLGSVAERVVRTSKMPVMTVRP